MTAIDPDVAAASARAGARPGPGGQQKSDDGGAFAALMGDLDDAGAAKPGPSATSAKGRHPAASMQAKPARDGEERPAADPPDLVEALFGAVADGADTNEAQAEARTAKAHAQSRRAGRSSGSDVAQDGEGSAVGRIRTALDHAGARAPSDPVKRQAADAERAETGKADTKGEEAPRGTDDRAGGADASALLQALLAPRGTDAPPPPAPSTRSASRPADAGPPSGPATTGAAPVIDIAVLKVETHFAPVDRTLPSTPDLSAALTGDVAAQPGDAPASPRGKPAGSSRQALRPRDDTRASDTRAMDARASEARTGEARSAGEASAATRADDEAPQEGAQAAAHLQGGADEAPIAASREAAPASPALGGTSGGAAALAGALPLTSLRQVSQAIGGELARIGAAVPGSPQAPVVAGPLRLLDIQLHPADLGTVTVRMRLSDEGLSVRISASNPQTAQLLQQDQARLGALLQREGIEAASITVVDPAQASGGWNRFELVARTPAPGEQESREGRSAGQENSQQGGSGREGSEDSSGRRHPSGRRF